MKRRMVPSAIIAVGRTWVREEIRGDRGSRRRSSRLAGQEATMNVELSVFGSVTNSIPSYAESKDRVCDTIFRISWMALNKKE